MSDPIIEPTLKLAGNAFVGNSIMGSRIIPRLKQGDYLKVVPLTEWCDKNFTTRRLGYKFLENHLLIGFRRHGIWWVKANPECLPELLDYLGIEELFFDAPN